MPLTINLRHLETHSMHLHGELPVEELDLELRDEIIRAERPLRYRLEVQKLEKAVLIQGVLRLSLQCECVRCLKPFEYRLELEEWSRHVPLDGEEKAVIVNDCVDLTPYLREDILLEFPQHPLCKANCGGLSKTYTGKAKKTSAAAQTKREASAWAELDKLKF
jgi:uncharacterized metal-binding protein YceD (DUF177 family)